MSGLLQEMLGGMPSTRYDVGYYQRQGLNTILGGGIPGPFGNPMGMAQQQATAEYQKRQQAFMQQAMQPWPPETPPRKKVESKVIDKVELRSEQDIKLLKVGEGI